MRFRGRATISIILNSGHDLSHFCGGDMAVWPSKALEQRLGRPSPAIFRSRSRDRITDHGELACYASYPHGILPEAIFRSRDRVEDHGRATAPLRPDGILQRANDADSNAGRIVSSLRDLVEMLAPVCAGMGISGDHRQRLELRITWVKKPQNKWI